MSGGHFDYQEHRISDITDEIEDIITNNDDKQVYSDETIKKFREAVLTLRKAAAMAHRIDWLVSGDEGEESFHRRWDEDVPK